MAETIKLCVEKALNELREADAQKSQTKRMDEEIDALHEEAKRLREQRLRLERAINDVPLNESRIVTRR